MPKWNAPAQNSMLRAVVDTNVLISGFLKGSSTRRIIQAWKEEQFILVTAEELIAELITVLARPKFQRYITRSDVQEIGELLYERAEIVKLITQVTLCRDPKDDIFLTAAIAGKVPYLVTGDDDLKGDTILKNKMLAEYGVQIVEVSVFMKLLAKEK